MHSYHDHNFHNAFQFKYTVYNIYFRINQKFHSSLLNN